jgi:hypothetical protein
MLTFGILWLDGCRQSQSGKLMIEGVKLFLPAGTSILTRERIAYLNPDAAKWHLYELNEREDNLKEIDFSDRGNVATRLVHAPNEAATYERFRDSIEQVREQMSEAEIAVLSPAEIAFRCHGLEFARARLAHDAESFQSNTEIVFGLGGGRKNTQLLECRGFHATGSEHRGSAPRWWAARSSAVAPASRALAGVVGGAGGSCHR